MASKGTTIIITLPIKQLLGKILLVDLGSFREDKLMDELRHSYRRYFVAVGLLLVLALVLALIKAVSWRSDVHFHTILEVVATVLAAVVGSLALVRFYSKKSNRFLFVGTGFIATALFDGYHAVVTSEWFYRDFPSDLSELTPWSWLVSRLFLGIFVLVRHMVQTI